MIEVDMNANEFQDEYAAALAYLGVRHGDEDFVEIWITDRYFTMSANGKSISIICPVRDK